MIRRCGAGDDALQDRDFTGLQVRARFCAEDQNCTAHVTGHGERNRYRRPELQGCENGGVARIARQSRDDVGRDVGRIDDLAARDRPIDRRAVADEVRVLPLERPREVAPGRLTVDDALEPDRVAVAEVGSVPVAERRHDDVAERIERAYRPRDAGEPLRSGREQAPRVHAGTRDRIAVSRKADRRRASASTRAISSATENGLTR